MGGRYTATTQGFQGGDSVVLAVTYPWAPASSNKCITAPPPRFDILLGALGALGVRLLTAHAGPGS